MTLHRPHGPARLAASVAASRMLSPAARRSMANSTIRMAFLEASPISMIIPICV